MAREPGYCHHKPTGQAYVRFNGKCVYLGVYGSPESKERYQRLKAEWLLNRHSEAFKPVGVATTMADVALAYLEHAEQYYAQSTEYVNLKLALRPVSRLYATLPARDFGPNEFRAVRDWWLSDPTHTRQYCNKQMKRLVRVVKWSVGAGMMPGENYFSIKCVDPLKKGRTTAPESKPVMPVALELVEETCNHLTPILADMVRFQLLTGCRPGELVKITPSMVDRSDSEVWTITLAEHKTAYRGKTRTIYVGPRAQEILAKYLLRAGDSCCFSPIESERQRREAAHNRRKTPLSCGNRPGTNRIARSPRKTPGESWTAGSYAQAICGACKRAKLQHWHPNQLRHTAATSVRKEFGLEGAQLMLGHAGADVTQVYAERDASRAITIARQIG